MSAILKAGTQPRRPVNPSSFHMRDLLAEAEILVEQARAQSSALLEQARRDAEQLRDSARREGHASGHETGLAAGREAGRQAAYQEANQRFGEDHARLVSALEQLVDGVSGERQERLHAAERDLLGFAIDIARRVTRVLGRLDPGVVRASLQAALQQVLKPTDVVVRVHPEDRATLERFAPQLLARFEDRPHIELLPDDRVERGGVRLRSGVTEVDATLAGQLDMICSALTGT